MTNNQRLAKLYQVKPGLPLPLPKGITEIGYWSLRVLSLGPLNVDLIDIIDMVTGGNENE